MPLLSETPCALSPGTGIGFWSGCSLLGKGSQWELKRCAWFRIRREAGFLSRAQTSLFGMEKPSSEASSRATMLTISLSTLAAQVNFCLPCCVCQRTAASPSHPICVWYPRAHSLLLEGCHTGPWRPWSASVGCASGRWTRIRCSQPAGLLEVQPRPWKTAAQSQQERCEQNWDLSYPGAQNEAPLALPRCHKIKTPVKSKTR